MISAQVIECGDLNMTCSATDAECTDTNVTVVNGFAEMKCVGLTACQDIDVKTGSGPRDGHLTLLCVTPLKTTIRSDGACKRAMVDVDGGEVSARAVT